MLAAAIVWGFIAVTQSQGAVAAGPYESYEACKIDQTRAVAHANVVATSDCFKVTIKSGKDA
jgi:hypothetical protein